MLNHESGLKALGGINDMRELRQSAAAGDQAARLATRVFCRSVAKAIAGLWRCMGQTRSCLPAELGSMTRIRERRLPLRSPGSELAVDIEANRAQRKEPGQFEVETVRKISE